MTSSARGSLLTQALGALTPDYRPAVEPALARTIRWVGFDVDGVLTDGGIYLGDVDGHRYEAKRYDIQDGLGVHLLRMAGIAVGIVTGRVSESVRLRAAELRADDVVQDPHARKVPALRRIAAERGIGLHEMAWGRSAPWA